ncbi:hypothetical protein B0G38_000704 [Arthrobacter sp. VKM Ac-2550]|nr:hypothetical protein [Arthrobacter sp. VKM Ac-2550]
MREVGEVSIDSRSMTPPSFDEVRVSLCCWKVPLMECMCASMAIELLDRDHREQQLATGQATARSLTTPMKASKG